MASELERLCGTDRMARPSKPLGEGTCGKRDPSPVWDAWYQLPLGTRRRLLPFMASPGERGELPDQLGQIMGVDGPDEAIATWAAACQLARSGEDLGVSANDWAWQATADALSDIVGPQEVADRLAVQCNTVHQWRKRGLMPVPARIISGVPLWASAAIDSWALETGRIVLEELPAF